MSSLGSAKPNRILEKNCVALYYKIAYKFSHVIDNTKNKAVKMVLLCVPSSLPETKLPLDAGLSPISRHFLFPFPISNAAHNLFFF